MTNDAGLTPDEWTVLQARAAGKTFMEAGRLIGRGPDRARQLEAQGGARLRRRLSPAQREQEFTLARAGLTRQQYAHRVAAWLLETWAQRDTA